MAATLSLIPDEVLVCIFSYIDSSSLITGLGVTCKRFRALVMSEWYWRRRYKENYNGHSPFSAITTSIGVLHSLMKGCVQGDYLRRISDDDSMISLPASPVGLDCVYIINPQLTGISSIIASGSRDHRIYLWQKRRSDSTSLSSYPMRRYLTVDLTGHRGWVWCLAGNHDNPNLLCSGSWDNEVKIWDIEQKQCTTTIRQHKGAVLSVAFPQPHLVVSACNDKLIRTFDLRSNDCIVCGRHSRAVLGVACNGEHYMYTCSEDRCVKLWDRRTPDVLLHEYKFSKDEGSSVMDICYNEGFLSAAVGTTVYFLTEQLVPLSSYPTGHSLLITSLYHDMGMIVTGSKDGTAQLHTMSVPHTPLKTIHHYSDVTDVCYSKGTFAISSSDKTVTLWTPK